MNYNEKQTDYFIALSEFYDRANETIIFLECCGIDQDVYIGLHNELRSALNHIMRMIKHNDDVEFEKEFNSAKSHLLRATYDSYELICIEQIDHINQLLDKKYSTTDIRIGLPDYFERILPDVVGIRKQIAKMKAQKKWDNLNGGDAIAMYSKLSFSLIEYARDVNAKIASIDACYTERIKKESKESKKFIWSIIINIAIATMFFLFGFLL